MTNGSENHQLFDTSRGNKAIRADGTNAERTASEFAFATNGFTFSSAFSSTYQQNDSYVAWCWKAGTGKVLNQDGNWNAQVNANRENGFSIITYDGAGSGMTIGHGLERAPEFIMFKALTSSPHGAQNWNFYHASQGATKVGFLNLDNAFTTDSGFMNNTAPTSSIITLGGSNSVSYTGQPYVAYAWHSVEGYSKVGGYYGNAQGEGSVIETGFKPGWIMIKRTASSGDWAIWDSVRYTTNPVGNNLTANAASPESSAGNHAIDILSSGFRIRSANTTLGGFEHYIYVAFAEKPTNAGFGAIINAG